MRIIVIKVAQLFFNIIITLKIKMYHKKVILNLLLQMIFLLIEIIIL